MSHRFEGNRKFYKRELCQRERERFRSRRSGRSIRDPESGLEGKNVLSLTLHIEGSDIRSGYPDPSVEEPSVSFDFLVHKITTCFTEGGH